MSKKKLIPEEVDINSAMAAYEEDKRFENFLDENIETTTQEYQGKALRELEGLPNLEFINQFDLKKWESHFNELSKEEVKNLNTLIRSVIEKGERIELGEEISPEYVAINDRGHSWWDGAEKNRETIYGIVLIENGKFKLEKLEDIKKQEYFSDNGTPYEEEGETLAEYLGSENPYKFFLVNKQGKEYGEDGEDFNITTVCKSPDFKKYWDDKMEEVQDKWEKHFDKLSPEEVTKLREGIESEMGGIEKIELMEKISPDFIPMENSGDWSGLAEEKEERVYGILFEEGRFKIEKLDGIKTNYSFYTNSGELESGEGETLAEYLGPKNPYKFFLVNQQGKKYGDNGMSFDKTRLYTSPDFTKIKQES